MTVATERNTFVQFGAKLTLGEDLGAAHLADGGHFGGWVDVVPLDDDVVRLVAISASASFAKFSPYNGIALAAELGLPAFAGGVGALFLALSTAFAAWLDQIAAIKALSQGHFSVRHGGVS